MKSVAGKHAVVTGGNRGIGAAIVTALEGVGATVSVLSRSTGIACDVSDENSVRAAFALARRQRGPVDILVNNAGQAEAAPLEDTSTEMWNRMLAVNLTGTFLCSREVIGEMSAAKQGRIINIASTAGLKGAARITAYCASKHGVIGFTRALAAETAKTGITVNAVCPSYTATDMTERTLAAVAQRRQTDRAGALALLERTIPIGRLITPEEVAAAVLYLCSPAAAAITGHAIAVDGGETQ